MFTTGTHTIVPEANWRTKRRIRIYENKDQQFQSIAENTLIKFWITRNRSLSREHMLAANNRTFNARTVTATGT